MQEPRRAAVSGAGRLKGRLDAPCAGSPEPSLEQVVAWAAGEPLELWGGEPTLRADLPALLAALPSPWMRCDGLALTRAAGALQPLLAGVTIVLPSGRRDASDWLLGRAGATRGVVAGIRAAVAAAIPTAIEIPLTRPTADHLGETVELAAHLGAEGLRLRRVTALGLDPDDFVALSPRLARLAGPLAEAARTADRRGVRLSVEGLPACVRGGIEELRPRWLSPRTTSTGTPCGTCPGAEACTGVDADYAGRFGLAEFPAAPAPGERVELAWTPDESTRTVRTRLARAARHGLPLRVLAQPSLQHPEAAELLRECTRLFAPDLELVGDLAGLDALDDDQLGRLRRFDRVRTPSADPVLARLHACTRGRVAVVLQAAKLPPDLPYPATLEPPPAGA